MKAPSFGYGRFALLAFALVALLLLQGCHEEHLAWSPDGRTLAVWNVGGGGIRFSDTTGALTPELYPGVRRAQWFADSRRLVLATSSELADWKTVEPLLDGPVPDGA